jgi:hypothetical protein
MQEKKRTKSLRKANLDLIESGRTTDFNEYLQEELLYF